LNINEYEKQDSETIKSQKEEDSYFINEKPEEKGFSLKSKSSCSSLESPDNKSSFSHKLNKNKNRKLKIKLKLFHI